MARKTGTTPATETSAPTLAVESTITVRGDQTAVKFAATEHGVDVSFRDNDTHEDDSYSVLRISWPDWSKIARRLPNPLRRKRGTAAAD